MAKYREKKLREAYEAYITDALRIITENTAKFAGGSYIKQRWIEMRDPKPPETRTPEEIKDYMKETLNRLGKGGAKNESV